MNGSGGSGIRMARAGVLALSGRAAEGRREYAEVWARGREAPEAAFAGWRAARLADSVLGDRAGAASLYEQLARYARDRTVRRLARAHVGTR